MAAAPAEEEEEEAAVVEVAGAALGVNDRNGRRYCLISPSFFFSFFFSGLLFVQPAQIVEMPTWA